jgi:hypothetical protein
MLDAFKPGRYERNVRVRALWRRGADSLVGTARTYRLYVSTSKFEQRDSERNTYMSLLCQLAPIQGRDSALVPALPTPAFV